MKRNFVITITILLCIVVLLVIKTKEPKEMTIKSNTININQEIFTNEELKWINEHKNRDINVGVAQDYIPIEYIDKDGNPSGMGIEIIKLISELTGLRFKMYKNSAKETWDEILRSTSEKRIDILPAVAQTKNRLKYLEFSEHYIEMTQVILGHKDNQKLVNGIAEVNKKSFVVPRGYWVIDGILKENPNAEIIQVENMEEALKYVSNKKTDYTICETPVFTCYREEGTTKNIKIVGELKEKNKIHMAVRKEYSELIPIINKVIESINYNELYEKALIMPKNNLNEKKLIFIILILTLIVLILIYYRYTTFRKLVIAKKEAEDANRHKTSLMTNISHDLRTPITVIMGYAQAIIDGNVKSEEDKEKYIRRIYEKTKYLNELVDDFFLLSRLEDGKLILVKEEVNINNFVKSIVEDTAFKAEPQNIELSLKLDEKVEIYKKVDRIKLYRAIENIIINAVKYTEENGSIEISTVLEDDKVKISIKDNGIGIQKEDITHIFDRYYKGKNARKESIGLGLYIAKEIIHKHNGEIWLESEYKKGSTFYILI
ncbi:ATP-binding protein [Oceanirhabdus seepicola]|uniref:histidine kinase n=1 Tax=Oceanirhabdus seepicola TaxID=2828781 RepID=A0A9J6NWH2_9CLOT|nr:transporter substrate-binding domain-containing protein [Oceanirhabdus seepicola]MCM1988358.1 transporter substrate-binding domain-containing protein [Oceanirhabdus seepicola]